MRENLEGIIPAVVTPLGAGDRVEVRSLEKLLERLYERGVHGVYLCGATGEGMLLSAGDRKVATEVAVKNTPAGKSVIVHVGANTTETTLALARHAAKTGAQAVSSLPPLVGGYSFAEIKNHYERLARECEAPLLVYFFPEIAPAIKTPEQIMELAGIENVAGLKFTDYDLYTMMRLKRRGATIFYGRDEMLAAGLLFGADGGIGSFYNVIPRLFLELWDHARARRWDEAKAVQERINQFLVITLGYPLVPALKAILGRYGIECGQCVAPRRQFLTAEENEKLWRELNEAGLSGSIL